MVAIKIVPIENDSKDLQREIDILSECKSPYVVEYKGSYLKDNDMWVSIVGAKICKKSAGWSRYMGMRTLGECVLRYHALRVCGVRELQKHVAIF